MKLERHAVQLAALGHVARLSILRAVVQAGPDGATTTELQERVDIPWTTLNHHLDRLVDSGLVTARREGKSVIHMADYQALRALTDFLWEDCCKRGKGSAKGWEVGIELATATPQKLTDELAATSSLLVTMGCGEACPVVPGLMRMDWPLEDPKGKPIERVRQIRDDVRQRVSELLRQQGWAKELAGRAP